VRILGGRLASNPNTNSSPYRYSGPFPHPDAKLTLRDVTIDQWSNVAAPNRWTLMIGFPTVVDGENVRFVRTAVGICNYMPGHKVSWRNIYLESAGQNAYYPLDRSDDGTFDHPESAHHAGGEVTFDGFIADWRFKPFAGTGFALHQWRIDNANWPAPGTNSAPGLALYRDGFVLMGEGRAYYAVQLANGSVFPGKSRMENVAWRSPVFSGGVRQDTGDRAPFDNPMSDRLYGSGNINFDNGRLLAGNINRAA
jgi:hypothetical protein